MKFKNILLYFCLTITTIIIYHFLYHTKPSSLAYIDTSKIMSEYNGAIDMKKIIQSKEKSTLALIDTLALELQTDIKNYEKERSGMSIREKQTTEELIGHKQQQFIQYKEATKNKVGEESQKLNADVISKINSVITEYGKENHFTFIFGTTSGNIVYADDAVNVTNEILKRLNK